MAVRGMPAWRRAGGTFRSSAGLGLYLVVAALVLVACPATARGLAAKNAQSAALVPDSALGAHAMLFFDTPLFADDDTFSQAVAEHASTVRLDIFLPQITDGDSQPDWTWVQRIAALAHQYRIRVLADLTGMPFWMSACPAGEPFADAYRCPAGDPGAWGQLVGDVAAHLRGSPVSFEIWNEPDGAWTFVGAAQQYGAMLAAAVRAIHTANPGAMVTNGGMMSTAGGGGAAWLSAALGAAGPDVWQRLSMLNVHIRGLESSLAGQLHAWMLFAAAHGRPQIPIWVTEAGYPADPAYQTDPVFQGGELAQARYVAAALRDLRNAGAAKIFVTQRDMAPGSGPFASEGVLAGLGDPISPDPQVTRRPAFYACRTFAEHTLTTGAGPPREQPGRSQLAPDTERRHES